MDFPVPMDERVKTKESKKKKKEQTLEPSQSTEEPTEQEDGNDANHSKGIRNGH